MHTSLPILCLGTLLTTACAGQDDADADEIVPFALTSPAFAEGETIPLTHECGPPFVADGPGDNISPQLSWTAGPEGTASYALIVRDRDALVPQFPEGIIHWALYNVPAAVTSLDEAIPEGRAVAGVAGALQAEIQGSGLFGYFGPCSPGLVNSYEFTVHAMAEASLALDGDESEANVATVVEASSLASASLTGES